MKKFIMTVTIILLTVTTSFAMGSRFYNRFVDRWNNPPVEDPVDPPVQDEYPDPIPTLLIHGYLGNPSNMLPLEEDMIAKGFPADMISRPSMSNAAGLNANLSADVSEAAEELKAKFGGQYDRVDIVGYSRGAMNGLDYILSGGAVRNFVGMDGYMPNEPSGDGTPGDTLYYCIDASLGNLATLDGAAVVESPMSHLSVWNSQAIFDLVQIGLNGNGSNE